MFPASKTATAVANPTDKLCWVKVKAGKKTGWVAASQGTNKKRQCSDVDKRASSKITPLLDYLSTKCSAAYCPMVTEVNANLKSHGVWTKNIIATKLLEDQGSCCLECKSTPRCVGTSYYEKSKKCIMTSNIWQVPDPTADLDGLQTSSKGTFVDAYVTSNKPLILWEYVKGYQDDIGNTYENHYRKTITKAAYAKVSVSLNRQGVVRDPDAFASSIPHKPGDCYVDVLHDGQFKLILKSTGGPLADFPCYKPKKVLLSLNKCG